VRGVHPECRRGFRAMTTIRFDEDIVGLGTFHRRGTVHFKKSDTGWQVTLANIS
jgi:hypothetical protein